MNTVRAAVAGCVLVLSAVTVCAQASFLSGHVLKERLADAHDSSSRGMAVGYIAGVYDTSSGVLICSPTEVTTGQLAAIVQKYLADNPQTLHITAHQLVINALSAAFPCRK